MIRLCNFRLLLMMMLNLRQLLLSLQLLSIEVQLDRFHLLNLLKCQNRRRRHHLSWRFLLYRYYFRLRHLRRRHLYRLRLRYYLRHRRRRHRKLQMRT
jgi:hypothetical protein